MREYTIVDVYFGGPSFLVINYEDNAREFDLQKLDEVVSEYQPRFRIKF